MPEPVLDALIDRIYDAAVEPAKWKNVIESVRDACGDGYGVLLQHDVAIRNGAWDVVAYLDDSAWQAYNRYYAARNPWLPNLPKRPVGMCVPAEFMLGRRDLEETEFYNDFLKRQGVASGLGVTLFKDDHRFVAFSILYSDKTAQRTKEHVALVQRLTPHLTRAFQLNRQFACNEFSWRSAEASLEALAVGVVILDPAGRALFLNRSAIRSLNENDGLSLDRSGYLQVRDSADNAKLRQLTAEALGHANRRTTGSGGALRVRRNSGSASYELLISPLRIPGRGFYGAERAVTVFIGTPANTAPLSVSTLSSLFGLSPAEAKLAIRLAGGGRLETAADELGIKKETARSQLKAIFAKTDTRRQAELAALLTRLSLQRMQADDPGDTE